MADHRTHEVEEELTGTAASSHSGDKAAPPAPAYQEGSVESVGGRPSGQDRDDRTGEGSGRGVSRREEGRPPDAFVSTEVNDRTATPGRDGKTRS
jgi:hypothetical protein